MKVFSDNKKSASYWKDIIFQASGNSTAQLIGIAGLPILTRLYTPEDFANQAIFIQITTFLVAFVTFRYEYFIPLLKSIEESIALSTWIIKFGLVMAMIFTLIMLAIDLSGILNASSNRFETYYYLAPLTAYLISISFLFQHELQRQGDYRLSGLSEIIAKSSYVASGVVGSIFNTGIALILTTLFGAIGKICCLFYNVTSKRTKVPRSERGRLVTLYSRRASAMVFANTLLTCSSLIPLYFISNQYGAVTLGQFSLVMVTIFLPSGLIGSAVGNVFYQRAGSLWNEENVNDLKALWFQTFARLLFLSLPIYIAASIVAPWLYPFVFGESWADAGVFARIITLAAFFSFVAGPLDRLTLILGVAYYLPALHVLRLISITLLSLIALRYQFTIVAYILGYAIVMSVIYIFDVISARYLLYRKCLKFSNYRLC